MLGNPMLDWYQSLPLPTRPESSSSGASDLDGGCLVLHLLLKSRFFPSANPAATDEIVIW